MKNTAKLGIAAAGVASLLQGNALGFVTFADEGGELILNLEGSAYYDSNISANANGSSDYLFEAAPELQFIRNSGIINLDARVGGAFGFFADSSSFDYQNVRSRLNITGPHEVDSNLSYGLNAGFNQYSTPDEFVGERIDYADSTGGINLRYDFSDKIGVGFVPSFLNRNYDDSRFTDYDVVSLRGDLYYIFSSKLEFNVGYRYRKVDGRNDFEDNAIILGINGQLTPKVSGVLEGGYQDRSGDSGEPFLNVQLNWAATDKLLVGFTAGKDFDVTANGFSKDSWIVGLDLDYALNSKIGVNVGVGWEDSDYSFPGASGRSDDSLFAKASVNYYFTSRSSMEIGMKYWNRDSNVSNADYDRFIGGVTFRYAF